MPMRDNELSSIVAVEQLPASRGHAVIHVRSNYTLILSTLRQHIINTQRSNFIYLELNKFNNLDDDLYPESIVFWRVIGGTWPMIVGRVA